MREDGTATEAELETRSFLRHDLAHYVTEKTAGKEHCFWGAIAGGTNFEQMGRAGNYGKGVLEGDEINEMEMIVAIIQGQTKQRRTGSELMAGFQNAFLAHGKPVPSYLDAAFVDRVSDEFIELVRRWDSLQISGSLTLTW